MRVMQWVQGVLVLGLVALTVLSSPGRGYAGSKDGDASKLGENENYVNIEEAMREYNSRYMYFYAEENNLDYEKTGLLDYFRWPDCVNLNTELLAAKPEDGTYTCIMQDKEKAAAIVAKVVDAFYNDYNTGPGATPLYAEFIKIEGETGTSFVAYAASDFPLTWVAGSPTYSGAAPAGNSGNNGVTIQNYKDVAQTITKYIKKLKAINSDNVSSSFIDRETRSGLGEAFKGADDAPDVFVDFYTNPLFIGWNDNGWGDPYPWTTIGALGSVMPDSGGYQQYADYHATRGRIQFTGSANSEFTLYLKVLTFADQDPYGLGGLGPFGPIDRINNAKLSNLPVAGNDLSEVRQWHKYMVFTGAGTHKTPLLAGEEPEWPFDTNILEHYDHGNTNEYWDYSWEIEAAYVAQHPQFDSSPDGGCDSCGGCAGECPNNQEMVMETGSLHFRIGLGMLNDEQTAGRLLIHAQEPGSELFKPTMLQAIVPNSSDIEVIRETDRTLRQVKTPNLLADVVVNTATEYEIRYYHLDQLEASKVGGYWVPKVTESPYRTIVVEKPGASDNNVRFTEKNQTGAVTLVNEFVWDGTDTWDLYEGLDKTSPTLASAKQRTSKQIDVDGNTRTETMKSMEAGGTVLSHMEEVYTQYPFGWVRTSTTVDPSGINLTETYTYYTTPGEDGYGKVKTYVSQAGYWEHYVYDSDNVLSKTVWQLGENQYDGSDIAALEAANVVVEIAEASGSKTIDGSAEDLHVVKVTTKALGNVEHVRYTIYRGASEVADGNLDEVWSLRSANTDPEDGHADTLTFIASYMNDLLADGDIDDADDAKHLRSRSWMYKADFVYDAMTDETYDAYAEPFDMARSISPDGQAAFYDYSADRTSVVARGYMTDPLATTPAVTYGSRTTSVVDTQGNLVSAKSEKISESDNSGNWFITAFTKTAASDDFGRPTETQYFFGEDAADEASAGTGTAAYSTFVDYGTSCCGSGEAITRTGRNGVEHETHPDDLGRTFKSVRAVGTSGEITSLMFYDAAGRVTASGIDENDDGDLDDPLDLKTVTEYDDVGRMTSTTDAEGRKSYRTYRRIKTDGSAEYVVGTDTGAFYWETRAYGNDADAPISVSWRNSQGNTVRSFTGSCASFAGIGGAPSGAESLTEHSRSTPVYDWANRMTEGRAYFDLAATPDQAGTSYLVTGTSEYDALGRGSLSIDATGNATKTVYEDGTGRAIKTLIGVDEDANGTVDDDELHTVSRVYYNKFVSENPTGDDRPWPTRVYTVKPGLDAAPDDSDLDDTTPALADYTYTETVERYFVDATDNYMTARSLWSRPEHGPWSHQQSDEEGRHKFTTTTRNGSTSYMLTANIRDYDSSGRAYISRRKIVNSGTQENKNLWSQTYFDDASRPVKVETTGRGYSKTEYDAYGRTQRTVSASDEGSNTDADAFTDDIILAESVPTYDKSGRVTGSVTYERAHDATATGLLSAAAADQSRATYSYTWYDDNGRQTHSAATGADASQITYGSYSSATPPSSSDDVLVAAVFYDAAGRVDYTTDNTFTTINSGRLTKRFYDDLGRTTHSVENWDDSLTTPDSPGSRDADVNRVTKNIYDNSATGGGARIETVAIDPDGDGNTSDNQSTHYIHSGEVDAAERGPIPINGRPLAILMPDALEAPGNETRAGAITKINNGTSGGDFSVTEYYANGQVQTTTDQRGVQRNIFYTDEGWADYTTVTEAAGNTWESTGDLRTGYTYGDAGEALTVTAYSDTAGTTATSKLTSTYDGFYNRLTEAQDHDPTANSGAGVPKTIYYTYDTTLDGSYYSKAYRLDTITYPNGRVIQLNYDGHNGIDDAISRANAIEEDADSTDIVSYTYLGSGRMARKSYPFTSGGVRLDMLDESGEGSDANDDYEVSLDAFGRPTRYQWETYDGSGDAEDDLVHIAHGYDRNSNRLYDDRKAPGNASYSTVFNRDEMDRINGYERGKIKSDQSGIESYWKLADHGFTYDQLGNAQEASDLNNPDMFENDTNKANELTERRFHVGSRLRSKDDFSSDTSVNWTKPGSNDAFTVNGSSSGSLKFTTVAQDTAVSGIDDPIAQAIVLLGEDIGPAQIQASIKFPSGATSGEAGIVFGYKSPTDYWLQVLNLADQMVHVYKVEDQAGTMVRVLKSSKSWGITAGTYKVMPTASRGDAILWPNGFDLDSDGGYPSGKIGLYSTIANTEFDYIYWNPIDRKFNGRGRWSSYTQAGFNAANDYVNIIASAQSNWTPVLLDHLTATAFEAKFRFTRTATVHSYSSVRLVFNATAIDDYDAVTVRLDTTGSAYAPSGLEAIDGLKDATVSSTRNAANVPLATNDEMWARVVSDGTNVKVYCALTEAALDALGVNDYAFTSDSFDMVGGQVGFAAASGHTALNHFELRVDLNADGDYADANETQLVEDFVDTANFGVLEPDYDAAGNLTFDGTKQYTYDAFNRLVKVQYAYKDSGGTIQPGITLAEYAYDAQSRRIRKDTYLGGVLDNVEHFYYIGGSLVETRNGSDQVLQQHVWDNLAGHYIDSLAQVANNADPGDATEGTGSQELCEDFYYALQDQQFNILAITDDTGAVVERYEYSLYGKRSVYNADRAPMNSSAYGVQMGFQGLYHDTETGLIYNRARMLDPASGRFIQRDPLGYPDGMNTYAAYHVLHGGVDPTGKDTIDSCVEGLETAYSILVGQPLSIAEVIWDNTSKSGNIGLSGTGALSPFGLTGGVSIGVNDYGQVIVNANVSPMLTAGAYFGGGITLGGSISRDELQPTFSLSQGVHAEANVGLGLSGGVSGDVMTDSGLVTYEDGEWDVVDYFGDDAVGITGLSGSCATRVGLGKGANVGVGPSLNATYATPPLWDTIKNSIKQVIDLETMEFRMAYHLLFG